MRPLAVLRRCCRPPRSATSRRRRRLLPPTPLCVSPIVAHVFSRSPRQGGGFGAGAAGSAVDALNNAPVPKKPKAASPKPAAKPAGPAPTVAAGGDDEESDEKIRGYKIRADGKKTSFFHKDISVPQHLRSCSALSCLLCRRRSPQQHRQPSQQPQFPPFLIRPPLAALG